MKVKELIDVLQELPASADILCAGGGNILVAHEEEGVGILTPINVPSYNSKEGNEK